MPPISNEKQEKFLGLDEFSLKGGTRSCMRYSCSHLRAIQIRLYHLKIGFFFVVTFGIPRITKAFRLEKSQF